MIDPDTLAAIAAVSGAILHGWQRTQRLGANLGPRLERLERRVAFLEGRAGVAAPELASPGTMEIPDGSRPGR